MAQPGLPQPESPAAAVAPPFREQFTALFDLHFVRIHRFLDRLSGEPELAADLAQETFVRLYRRGAVPDAPPAWLVSVALNLFRNARSSRRRRRLLLTPVRAERAHSDPSPSPDQAPAADESRRQVRATLDRMPEREQRLLLLRAEGYSYRDIAHALSLNEASVGIMLARAKRAFRDHYEGAYDAP